MDRMYYYSGIAYPEKWEETFDLPYLDVTKLKVSASNGYLLLEYNNEKDTRREYFQNTFYISNYYDLSKTEVTYENGYLTISVPRSSKNEKTFEVRVK